MNPNDNDDGQLTRSASPSSAEPASTYDAHADAGRAHGGPSAGAQLRDPGRYQIINEHGRGGLGRVSRAHDCELGRDVAIKELISRGNLSEVRFLREALITARLQHPGIVPVYEAGRWPDGTPFYAMKLVAGRALRDLITERTTVTERIGLLHHVIAVADAIAYAHGRNIIHRDLKPANVIVGDFGETIVIDWGLAKDLSTTGDSTSSGGPFRANHDTDLTSTGSVLGTPTYMPPEQARGEPVDQRADVFAIGAMLWDLCSLQKVPPTDPHLRHGMLRRSGIDRDLATIIDKALAADAQRRYPDAGALAADLKAFKAGARIAARSYSAFGMLAHWTRRHRALSLATTAVVAIAIVGIALYIKNIASERDRADNSEEIAKRSRATAEASLDELTLEHAELLLTTDPSTALDSLATYHGGNRDRATQIRAEATGRGVALLRAKPHTDRIQWAAGSSDHAVISLSIDGTISRTSADQQSSVLATGVSLKGRIAYAQSRGLLAYGCDPSDVCMWDVLHSMKIALSPELRGWQLAGLAFSPDGSKLALLSYSGLVRVFDVSVPAHPVACLEIHRDQGVGILFADDDTIVVGLEAPLRIELIRMNGETQALEIHDHFMWEAIPDRHRLVLITNDGDGLYLARDPLHVLNRVALCHGAPTGVRILPDRHTIAYSCEEGTVGIWDLERRIPDRLTHMEGHTDRIAVSQSGDYLLAAGSNGMLAVIDLSTKLIATYRGHSFNLTSITPPTEDFPYLVSADVRGSLRVWPLPSRIARVSANLHTRFASAVFNKPGNAILATTFRSEIASVSPPHEIRAAGPHLVNATNLALADDGNTFAAYGASESIEIWTARSLVRQRVIATGQGAISRVAFLDQTDEFASAGRDGRLIYWTSAGNLKRVIQLDHPIIDFLVVPDGKFAVINTSDGAIWRANEHGELAALHGAGIQVLRMLNIPRTASIVLAYANGDVVLLDTISWRQTLVFHTAQAVRDIAVTPDGRTIAVAESNDTVHVGKLHGDTWTGEQAQWTSFPARAHKIALAPDGLLVAIYTDGTVWGYSSIRKNWLCLPASTGNVSILAISADGKTAAVFDADGRVISLDLELVRKSLADNSNDSNREKSNDKEIKTWQ